MGCHSSKEKKPRQGLGGHGSNNTRAVETHQSYHTVQPPSTTQQVHTETPPPKPRQQPQPQPQPQPQSQAPIVTQPKPSPPQNARAVQKTEANTILGKPFEDIKKHYTLGKELGRGQFGITYLCTENSSGQSYACKSILKRKLVSKADREDMKREIQMMQHLSGQPNIVEFKGAFEDRYSVHLVMELCAGGELFDRIIAEGHYSERAAASICRAIVNVVHICHFMGVMHRDLKPENFLLSSKDEGATLKATDFGLSVFIEEGKVYRDMVGSVYYVAPEVLRRSYGKEIDIWSAGIILYILLSGVPPFWAETEKGIFDAILEGEIDFVSEPWPSISDSAKDLVKKMLTQDPKKRITSAQVLVKLFFVQSLLPMQLVPITAATLPRCVIYAQSITSILWMKATNIGLLLNTKHKTWSGKTMLTYQQYVAIDYNQLKNSHHSFALALFSLTIKLDFSNQIMAL